MEKIVDKKLYQSTVANTRDVTSTQEYYASSSRLRVVPKFIEKPDSHKVGHALGSSRWPRRYYIIRNGLATLRVNIFKQSCVGTHGTQKAWRKVTCVNILSDTKYRWFQSTPASCFVFLTELLKSTFFTALHLVPTSSWSSWFNVERRTLCPWFAFHMYRAHNSNSTFWRHRNATNSYSRNKRSKFFKGDGIFSFTSINFYLFDVSLHLFSFTVLTLRY